MSITLGLSSFAYGWSVGVPGQMSPSPLDAQALIGKTIDFELNCLQIGDNLPLHTLDANQRVELLGLLTKHDIRLEVGARKLTPEHLHTYIEIASFFKSPLLRFVVDGDGYEPNEDAIVSIVREALPALYNAHIVLGIENHDRFKARELARTIDLIADPNVGICLDCVNSLGAGEGLDHVLDVLGPHTVNLHIKDFIIERLSYKMGFHVTGTKAGNGMTNIPRLLDQLLRYGRCKSAVLEQWVPPETSIHETIKKEEAWAVDSMNYLKGLSYFEKSI